MHSNLAFGGVAPSGGARLSTQEVWQKVSDMAGQVRALSDLNTSLHNALHATLLSTVMGPAPNAAKLTQELQEKIENDDEKQYETIEQMFTTAFLEYQTSYQRFLYKSQIINIIEHSML